MSGDWFSSVLMTLAFVLVGSLLYSLGHLHGECQGYCTRAGEYVTECTTQKVMCASKPSWATEPPVESK